MIKLPESLIQKFIFSLVLPCVMIICGCGYHFLGTGALPDDITQVYVRMLENQTREIGLENRMTDELIVTLSRGNTVISKSEDAADAILSGVITKMQDNTVSRTQQERRITMWVDLKLTAGGGKVIWAGRGISDNRIYTTVSGSGSAETRESAIRSLCERISQMAYQRMTNDF